MRLHDIEPLHSIGRLARVKAGEPCGPDCRAQALGRTAHHRCFPQGHVYYCVCRNAMCGCDHAYTANSVDRYYVYFDTTQHPYNKDTMLCPECWVNRQ